MTSRHIETWVGQALWAPALSPQWPSPVAMPTEPASSSLTMISQNDQPTPLGNQAPSSYSPQARGRPSLDHVPLWAAASVAGFTGPTFPKHIFLCVLHSTGVCCKGILSLRTERGYRRKEVELRHPLQTALPCPWPLLSPSTMALRPLLPTFPALPAALQTHLPEL